MKLILLIVFMFCSGVIWADEDRYLQANKVFYETPLEEDVMNVHLAFGYCTVLQFPEKPILVTVGDNSLVQVEIPKNSKSVVIKPVQEAGETNIFIFTPNHRFNYNAVIGEMKNVDYVLDAKVFNHTDQKNKNRLTVEKLIKIARDYEYLKTHNAINGRIFANKRISHLCSYPEFKVKLIEVFSNDDPNYVLLHFTVSNETADQYLNLAEQKTDILVNDRQFVPQYVLFDNDELFPNDTTDGWVVLENSYVSIDNNFSLRLGVGDQEYVCKQSIS
jgi:hypothetical protein